MFDMRVTSITTIEFQFVVKPFLKYHIFNLSIVLVVSRIQTLILTKGTENCELVSRMVPSRKS